LAKRIGTFYKVGDIIALFVQMGCDHNIAEETIEAPDGDCYGLSYLFNPTTAAHVPIIDLGSREYVSHWEVSSWERRLGIIIPRPPPL
jgi:hypothetical protein